MPIDKGGLFAVSANSPTGLTPARFPDIYYLVQPVVQNILYMMDDPYMTSPSQLALDQMVDRAYEELLAAYPDMAELEESVADSEESVIETQFRFGRPFFRRPFRRRGVFRDLLTILLLEELFRRRGF